MCKIFLVLIFIYIPLKVLSIHFLHFHYQNDTSYIFLCHQQHREQLKKEKHVFNVLMIVQSSRYLHHLILSHLLKIKKFQCKSTFVIVFMFFVYYFQYIT